MNKFDKAYAPPQSNVTPPPDMDVGEWEDASNGVRFANLLIDSVCRLVFAVVFGAICGAIGVDLQATGMSLLIGLMSILGYYLVLEALFGRTIGKLITGTRVVARDGGKPKLSAIVGRTFARFIPFEPFSFLGSSGGWHDTLSGTRVVKARR